MPKHLRFGIFGVNRGGNLIKSIFAAGAEVVALCDRRLDAVVKRIADNPDLRNCASYDNFEEFLQHDMDVVLLGNFFCEHAEYAIQAMRAGKHVLSETMSNITMAEGVALCRTKEETGMTYALLENYPFSCSNLEMERVYKEGTLGKLVFAEGEYSHPMSMEEQNRLARGKRHWRNWTPRTYYSTHALAPLMQMTDSMPTKVTAMASFVPDGAKGTALQTGDAAAVILCQTDTNAVLRVVGWANYAPHGSYYRLHCTKGGIELNPGNGKMRLVYNAWTTPEGMEPETEYEFGWQDKELGKLAGDMGHGGSDFFVIYNFVKDLEAGREPYWNVYRSTAAASVAILAWRSILNGNACYDIPDFRREDDRKKYEHDSISPYPDENYCVNIPCSSQPYEPTEEDLKNAHAYWEEGYLIE